MARSPSIDISAEERARLLAIARASISTGFETGHPLRVPPDDLSGVLESRLASFVTLRQDSRLRGCMGTLAPVRPLARDVAHTAFNAAFRDPRFARMTPDELARTRIEISVLTPMASFEVRSEQELFATLTPLEDGLLLEDELHRATFLPKVWESLPEPADFVRALKLKAGLREDHPVERLRLARYGTISFSDEAIHSAATI